MRDGFHLPFSPEYTFFACRPITINGVAYKHGDVIPPDALTERRLRQLYSQRTISPHVPAFLMNGATPGERVDAESDGAEHAPASRTRKKKAEV